MRKPIAYSRQIGRDFTKGVLDELIKLLFWIILVSVVFNYFRETDATDENWFYRSGVKIITDKRTGCEYFLGGSGGVVLREGVPCTK